MSGDLEDFLRRAAERRAQKQQQAGDGGQDRKPRPQRPKPQYTEARRERQIRRSDDDAIPVAEAVEPVNPLAEQERRLAESKRKAEEARQKLAKMQAKRPQSRGDTAEAMTIPEGTPAEQLLEMIRRPDGLKQAFLLREILDRPSDRW